MGHGLYELLLPEGSDKTYRIAQKDKLMDKEIEAIIAQEAGLGVHCVVLNSA